jgi:uridine phosphorylase
MSLHTPDPTRIILRPGQRVYHLDLAAGEIADTIITVGDPARVELIRPYFDKIELERNYREFKTITGLFGGNRLTVMSTGMGSDNIDIAINELELVANWDLNSCKMKEERTSLRIIRLGTSGALQEDLEVDSLLLSDHACSMDLVHHFYPRSASSSLEKGLNNFAQENELPRLYCFESDRELLKTLSTLPNSCSGLTYTASGFYAPQGRELWNEESNHLGLLDILSDFSFAGKQILNVEMETAAMLHLGGLFGHRMASISALLANRPRGEFSQQADKTIVQMIENVLKVLF